MSQVSDGWLQERRQGLVYNQTFIQKGYASRLTGLRGPDLQEIVSYEPDT